MSGPAQHPASNSTARKRAAETANPAPRCTVCGNSVPVGEAVERARAEGRAEALASVRAELVRLNTIGATRFDLIPTADWDWFARHPLKRDASSVTWSEAIPALVAWLGDPR